MRVKDLQIYREAYKLMTEEEDPGWTSVQQKEIEVEV